MCQNECKSIRIFQWLRVPKTRYFKKKRTQQFYSLKKHYTFVPLAMKKFFYPLMLTVLVTLSFVANGQISVGPKAGINFNSFRNSEEYRNYFDVIPGFNVGAFGKYPVLPFLTARAELIYMQQGANLYDYYVISELFHKNSRIRFHMLEIPVLAEFGLPSLAEDDLQPKLLLGGFYSTVLYTRETYTNIAKVSGTPAVSYEGSSEPQELFNRSQYGLVGALAADMKIFNQRISLEFRYQYNVNPINKSSSRDAYNMRETHAKWGNKLYLHTLSVNVAVPLYNL